MTKNYFVNALSAITYIVLVVTFIYYGEQFFTGREETIILPISILSLLVLSVATMAGIFFLTPLRLMFEGDTRGAVDLFLKTLVTFLGAVIVAFTFAFLGAF